jgi:hypothetical protein
METIRRPSHRMPGMTIRPDLPTPAAFPGTQSRLSSETAWTLALAVVAAVLFPLSREIAGLQDGDGILTSLISTQKLTWYFWGQDRILNLIPALASPIHDLIWNQRAQIFLRTLMSVLAPVGVLMVFRQPARRILLVTAASQLVLAVALNGAALFNLYAEHNPFSSSLVMFAISIALFDRLKRPWAIPAAIIAAFIAYATNIALIILTLPLLLLCLVTAVRPRRQLAVITAVQVVSVLLAYFHAKAYGEATTSFGVNVDTHAMLVGWQSVARHVNITELAVLMAAATVAAATVRTRESITAWLVAAGMPVAITAMSCMTWLQLNEFNVRYYLVFVVVFATCCAYLIVSALPISAGMARFKPAIAAIMLSLVFFIGLRGMSNEPGEIISARWRAQSMGAAQVAVDEHAELIVGMFWDVWPAVFMAREDLRDEGHADAPLFGATFRGHVLRKKIMKMMRERDLTSVCFQSDVGDCVRTTNFFITGAQPVRLVPDTLKRVTAGGHELLVYKVTARPTTP